MLNHWEEYSSNASMYIGRRNSYKSYCYGVATVASSTLIWSSIHLDCDSMLFWTPILQLSLYHTVVTPTVAYVYVGSWIDLGYSVISSDNSDCRSRLNLSGMKCLQNCAILVIIWHWNSENDLKFWIGNVIRILWSTHYTDKHRLRNSVITIEIHEDLCE